MLSDQRELVKLIFFIIIIIDKLEEKDQNYESILSRICSIVIQ